MTAAMDQNDQTMNAFCVDLEEWFHVCGVHTPYDDPATWDGAPSHVVQDTETLLRLLDETGAKGTFLTVGWVAEKHPDLIRRLVDGGHEIGCHSHGHRLVFEMTPQQFEQDLKRSLSVLRQTSGQPVTTYRAPGFSMKPQCFWAYPILKQNGIETDVSIVPAARDHGGVAGFERDPFILDTDAGDIRVFPVSVMQFAGRTMPFSGGGYLRLFPMRLVHAGFRQNHRAGRPGMAYIHPREINVNQPRLKLPLGKYFKYYVGLRSCERKLRDILHAYRFSTISAVMAHQKDMPRFRLDGEQMRRAS